MPDLMGRLTEADVVKIQAFVRDNRADAIRPKEAPSTGQAKQ
jgi:hypothetical protein